MILLDGGFELRVERTSIPLKGRNLLGGVNERP